MGDLEASTDGERIMQLDGKIDKLDTKIDNVCDSIDRVVVALEKLETTRVTDHEIRISKLEKWQSEWAGAYRLIAICGLLLGLISLIVTISKWKT